MADLHHGDLSVQDYTGVFAVKLGLFWTNQQPWWKYSVLWGCFGCDNSLG